MTEKLRRVGVIIKTHGLKGGVKVYPTTDDPMRLSVGKQVYLDLKKDMLPLKIRTSSVFKNLFILTFEEFSDINEVEGYKGMDLLAEDESEELAEGEYYVDDLIGLSVVSDEGEVLGTLSEVIKTGANDVYAVDTGEKEILIPAIADCILSVSLTEGTMQVHLLPGLV